MPRFIPLSTERHRADGWAKTPDYAFAVDRPVAELVAEEIPRALPTLPLAFMPEGEQWALVALLSLDSQRNLFVHPDGRWMGGYIPAAFRGYPFALLHDTEGGRRMLGFDADSGLWVEGAEDERRFFDDEGKLNQPVERVMTFLRQYDDQRRATRRAVTALAEAGVVVPWAFSVKDEAGNARRVDGVYRTDEAALKALPGETLSELATSGALAIAYAQLYAQHRLPGLTRLADLQAKVGEHRQAGESVDVERLFDGDDEELTFDFGD
ncbi:SapC family protein [Halomonas coralii]|uniref:SapC family protein n=1 Tax=Modicisalibacter sp. R2A 31.J TaxID=2831898 RepID=UPI001CCE059D|nr:SapC family protein [Modicisalibacter sp. R2A 31.J]MBZ9557618.1 SapC family protein [Modicisalibacter sp. R2A 31.J]